MFPFAWLFAWTQISQEERETGSKIKSSANNTQLETPSCTHQRLLVLLNKANTQPKISVTCQSIPFYLSSHISLITSDKWVDSSSDLLNYTERS